MMTTQSTLCALRYATDVLIQYNPTLQRLTIKSTTVRTYVCEHTVLLAMVLSSYTSGRQAADIHTC